MFEGKFVYLKIQETIVFLKNNMNFEVPVPKISRFDTPNNTIYLL